MAASQRLFLKIHQAIAEKAGGDLVGYSVYRALRLEALQISSLLDTHDVYAETFARMHAEGRMIGATRRMFERALEYRRTFGERYHVDVELKTRGVTKAPIVTGIWLWDIDPLNKIRIRRCS